jgi:NAD(P)-dependent dehydrogenase (short-subunit alcohol dehydrogenase family)
MREIASGAAAPRNDDANILIGDNYMGSFEGQLVFVTGGATGIGAAIVERFATLGADVACCYHRSRAGAEALAARLHERALSVFPVQADVSHGKEVRTAIEAAVAHFNRPVGILVNNAGDNIEPQPVESMPEELWDQVLGINHSRDEDAGRRADHQRHLDLGAHGRWTRLGALRREQSRAGGIHPLAG